MIRVRKQLEISGSSEKDLDDRVDAMCREVRARKGNVLDIKWSHRHGRRGFRASVLCQVPLTDAANLPTG